MHFDDRLETVLRLPDSGDGLARIQYRQLIDILGRLPGDVHSEAVDAGLARIEALSARIPVADRARLLRQPLQPLTNPRLLCLLAQAEPDVASAAIGAARLGDAEWLALIPELPVRARGILRHRRDLSAPVETLLERLGIRDRALPPIAEPCGEAATGSGPAISADQEYISGDVLELLDFVDDPPPPTSLSEWAQARAAKEHAALAAASAAPVSASSADAGIGAIVRRIEEFRKAREAKGVPEPGTDAPRLPLGDTAPVRLAVAVDFATDPEGRITWADGPCAPAVFGLNLTVTGEEGIGDHALGTAIRHRLPLRAARLRVFGAPAVSGEWQVDAVPQFDPMGGRFIGYCGRMRRSTAAPLDLPASTSGEADRMREILHELRTPANAIQVAAEIIQQQLYGPAPHEYRALAAAIAGDCAHILAGFEELDRLVKLETGALTLDAGECDLAQVLAQTITRLRAWTDPRRSGFAVDPATTSPALPVRVDRAETEHLVWRLFAALAGATAPDEVLSLSWTHEGGRAMVHVTLPSALASRERDDLFGTPPGERGQALSAGMFGIGFTLRLAAAEAAAAGGGLRREHNTLCLWLPDLTPAGTGNSTVENYSR
ncbi:hypothetical protein SAMN05518801_10210 [Novosphingobium sp. CF614]|uniref:HAMP domain-containing histidine kinase n=1 Tax=Novosphingobium sp. CF614 TaxID=1884364 RepID=UPI0008DFD685|nr:HAMP domain-containing histidine kinase [Novosphingobium sp. CF614]SFF82372.1 hypothetical protein SAMN05518801_10210 [Novosphingobium sp. CF614]